MVTMKALKGHFQTEIKFSQWSLNFNYLFCDPPANHKEKWHKKDLGPKMESFCTSTQSKDTRIPSEISLCGSRHEQHYNFFRILLFIVVSALGKMGWFEIFFWTKVEGCTVFIRFYRQRLWEFSFFMYGIFCNGAYDSSVWWFLWQT